MAAWTLVRAEIAEPLPHVYGGSQAAAIVPFDHRFLAFGGVNGGCCDGGFSTDTHAVAWSTTDGVSWALEADPPEFALGTVTAAAVRGSRIVVAGTRRLQSQPGEVDERGAVWTSDDGKAWLLAADAPVLDALVARPDAFIGVSNGPISPELLTSTDGAAWERVPGAGAVGGGRIERLLVVPNGILAVGSSAPSGVDAMTAPAAAWWSAADGAWARIEAGGAFGAARIVDVASSSGLVLAVGEDRATGLGAVWVAGDGTSWERVAPPVVADGQVRVGGVIGVDGGYLVVGTSELNGDDTYQVLTIWSTVDARSWSIVSTLESGDFAEFGTWTVASDGSVLVVGRGWDAAEQRPIPMAMRLVPATAAPAVR